MSEEKTVYELAHKLFAYETGTGYLIRKFARVQFPAGSIAGSVTARGYIRVSADCQYYLAHRLIYLMHYGVWPDQIDHINGIRCDNRLENLRSVGHAGNMRNLSLPKNNTSGVIGVSWCKYTGKWVAKISADNHNKLLGYFPNKQDAIDARKAAEIEYGYHSNHGMPARIKYKSTYPCTGHQ